MKIRRILASLCARGVLGWLPDKQYLQLYYYGMFGKWIDFDNPKTFNEKLQWLKLYDRKEAYTKMVDKYLAKEYVAQIIGKEHIIPTLAVWDSVDNVRIDELPDQFVLKTTHDSGGIVICKDKTNFDLLAAKKRLRSAMKADFYRVVREWPYKNVEPRIIAEEYMKDLGSDELIDYKVHCFNGRPRFILVCKDRFSENGMTEDFFDTEWNHLEVKRPTHQNSELELEKPELLDEMLQYAKALSENIPFIRVDFYLINSFVYFGELTFFPASGFDSFVPESFDKEIGEYLVLPY